MSRKKAAAVPASKAKIGAVYAVRRDGQLTRFRVQQVTIHRVADDGSPHDYKSENTAEYDAPFRLAGYSGTSPPDIGRKGVKPLLDGLRKLIGNADLAHSANLIEREKIDS